MAGFSIKRAREVFSIPEGFTPLAMIAVGHYGRIEDLPEDRREAEVAARERKPIEEIAFWHTWGGAKP
jgi:hypothetical protein